MPIYRRICFSVIINIVLYDRISAVLLIDPSGISSAYLTYHLTQRSANAGQTADGRLVSPAVICHLYNRRPRNRAPVQMGCCILPATYCSRPSLLIVLSPGGGLRADSVYLNTTTIYCAPLVCVRCQSGHCFV